MGRLYKMLVDVEHVELLLTKYGTQMKGLDLKTSKYFAKAQLFPLPYIMNVAFYSSALAIMSV